jgi:hypothetical protein
MANDDTENTPTTRQDIDALLTAFHGHGLGQPERMHDVESSEHAIKLRLSALEERVLELEKAPAPQLNRASGGWPHGGPEAPP